MIFTSFTLASVYNVPFELQTICILVFMSHFVHLTIEQDVATHPTLIIFKDNLSTQNSFLYIIHKHIRYSKGMLTTNFCKVKSRILLLHIWKSYFFVCLFDTHSFTYHPLCSLGKRSGGTELRCE